MQKHALILLIAISATLGVPGRYRRNADPMSAHVSVETSSPYLPVEEKEGGSSEAVSRTTTENATSEEMLNHSESQIQETSVDEDKASTASDSENSSEERKIQLISEFEKAQSAPSKGTEITVTEEPGYEVNSSSLESRDPMAGNVVMESFQWKEGQEGLSKNLPNGTGNISNSDEEKLTVPMKKKDIHDANENQDSSPIKSENPEINKKSIPTENIEEVKSGEENALKAENQDAADEETVKTSEQSEGLESEEGLENNANATSGASVEFPEPEAVSEEPVVDGGMAEVVDDANITENPFEEDEFNKSSSGEEVEGNEVLSESQSGEDSSATINTTLSNSENSEQQEGLESEEGLENNANATSGASVESSEPEAVSEEPVVDGGVAEVVDDANITKNAFEKDEFNKSTSGEEVEGNEILSERAIDKLPPDTLITDLNIEGTSSKVPLKSTEEVTSRPDIQTSINVTFSDVETRVSTSVETGENDMQMETKTSISSGNNGGVEEDSEIEADQNETLLPNSEQEASQEVSMEPSSETKLIKEISESSSEESTPEDSVPRGEQVPKGEKAETPQPKVVVEERTVSISSGENTTETEESGKFCFKYRDCIADCSFCSTRTFR
ncbi:unnamed protein product [Hymenolepis diminuta]|uniref:Uncharacterized protein n=1 Tax=Hymenolepis diminuta TaxID=6216 RepID=A0A564YSR3_HYMDI|nr:unnamed protein product [Hymenolepis diminuta]